MSGVFSSFEARVFRAFRRDPPKGWVRRGAFWLFLLYLASCCASLLPGAPGDWFRIFRWLTLFPLAILSLALLFRWVFGQLLWKVRNRLMVTYLLMGLAPLVLFATLTLLVAYVFSGQFATLAATTALRTELVHLGAEDRDFALYSAYALAADPRTPSIDLPHYQLETKASGHENLQLAGFENGRKLPLAQGTSGPAVMEGTPAWVENGFEGIVVDGPGLYLRAVEKETIDGHTATLVASLPVEQKVLDRLAEGLGNIHLFAPESPAAVGSIGQNSAEPGPAGASSRSAAPPSGSSGGVGPGGAVRPGTHVLSRFADTNAAHVGADVGAISGGALPPAKNFFDIPVEFFAPLTTVEWQTGKPQSIILGVTSRPGLLYDELFTTSFQTGTLVHRILIGIAILFCVLELIAFFMAIRLNRTITQSIHDLYRATTEIDQGHLRYRIAVKRRDQLAALSGSFNRMAASLDRLLAEQREKQRLENELTIAQEVQANLFPLENLSLPTLELHGVCRPARMVSGDYYDFLMLSETEIFLALGDISGKGISAALLMATLHSAVRAYRFAGDELEGVRPPAGSSRYSAQLLEDRNPSLFESPGRILELLNRQLFRSTQPEKYATLFLARYEAGSGTLTYSNGGHLPPLVLRSDGSVNRLNRGGTVVGLMDERRYEQDSVRLQADDLLIAYSDGVTEPENEFGEFSEERLLDVIRRNRHLPLTAISDQVLQALRAWIGEQEQPDDVTLVLARQR